jgi:hypothetical protein
MQSSSGCSCIGPHGLALIDPVLRSCGLDRYAMEALLDCTDTAKEGWLKPGFCGVFFSHLCTSSEVDYVVRAVLDIAQHGWKLLPQYQVDPVTGALQHEHDTETNGARTHTHSTHTQVP